MILSPYVEEFSNKKRKKKKVQKAQLDDDILDNSYLKNKFLIENITQMSDFRKNDNDFVALFIGNEGCLTGDTIISCGYTKYTLKELYALRTVTELSKMPSIKSFNGKSIKPNKIIDVVYSGKKAVWELTLINGKTIKGTRDHKIMTRNGWVELGKMTRLDEVMCRRLSNSSDYRYVNIKSIKYKGIQKTYDIQCADPYHNFLANDMVVHNSGKSTLAAKCAKFIDTISPDGKQHFDMDNVVFTADDFLLAVHKAKMYDIIVFDEAVQGLYSKDALSGTTIEIEKLLTIIRWKRLVIILCIPDIFMANSFIRGRRARCVIRTTFMIDNYGELHKGYFKFYSSSKMVSIKKDQITRRTKYPSPNFVGTFDKFDDGDEFWENYLRKKKNQSSETKINKRAIAAQLKRQKMLEDSYSMTDISRMTGRNRETIRNWMKLNIWPKKAIVEVGGYGGFGQKRILHKYYQKGIDKLFKLKEKTRKKLIRKARENAKASYIKRMKKVKK